MKQDIRCKYCGELLGHDHFNRSSNLIVAHYREKHPAAWQEMVEAKNKLEELKKKYGYYFMFCESFLKNVRRGD